ncbi:sigma 54-interacting transcriptional regulator [Alkalicella caledoniensis]|uniref:Sigma 54-interacting transcriptional regulator n=1 Tax=Alkalicella caledoniensis TaxID=2731377 RepID=A0A7G9W8V9_ALKCA|nr:sigma 54-interacting transcriptional regulator [Alkalicella caledoniensis]QNO15121.1 sigma 54-interacting transcriptional regulator [Alkalicella caledoniensis]
MKNEIISGILESIDEGIHAVDKNGITIYYNPKAASLDGLEPSDVIGKDVLEIFPSLDRSSSTLIKVLKSQKPIFNQQQTYSNYKGKTVITVNTTLPIFRHNEFIGAVEISKDVTQVKQLSDKVHQLQLSLYKRDSSKDTKLNELYQFGDILGNSKELLTVIKKAEQVAKNNSTIVVFGETGVGKELLVQSIHSCSPRQNKPFIAQNCAALPESLLEGILFGTVKGSFTGAENKGGLFELASGGTLFLDEINTMPQSLQAKILRAIEEKKIRRIGDTKEREVDVRIVVALNIAPEDALEKGQLREDLYYRLNVVNLKIPPLRDRKEDIPVLIDAFIDKYNNKFNAKIMGMDNRALKVFIDHQWPGNIRELKNYIEQIFNFKHEGIVKVEDLPSALIGKAIFTQKNESLREKMFNYEKDIILQAYLKNQGNVTKTAQVLEIPRQTLQYKLKQLNIKTM